MVSCSTKKKQPCMDSPDCNWVVGKGCKSNVKKSSPSVKTISVKSISAKSEKPSFSDISYDNSYNNSPSFIQPFDIEFYFNKNRIDFKDNLTKIKSEQDYKNRISSLNNEQYKHRVDKVLIRTRRDLMNEAKEKIKRYGPNSKEKIINMMNIKNKELVAEYNRIAREHEKKRKEYIIKLNNLYKDFKKNGYSSSKYQSYESKELSYNTANSANYRKYSYHRNSSNSYQEKN